MQQNQQSQAVEQQCYQANQVEHAVQESNS
jgi:hypothetical protein